METQIRITKKKGGYGFYLKRNSYTYAFSGVLFATKEDAQKEASKVLENDNKESGRS